MAGKMSYLMLFLIVFIIPSAFAEEFQFSDEDYAVYMSALGKANARDHHDDIWINGTFPDGFYWACATSAYQIEGAWDADGKGESIWDRRVHTPGNIEDGDTGDISCNSYYQYEEDVANLVYLGVTHYRFSIAWTRIQPTGQEATAHPAGVAYYNNLINALLAAGIEPMVTLYHWDLPQALEDHGGWLNESVIVPAFAHYARLCFEAFGDRAKIWITHNEPIITANLGYGWGSFAPGVYGPGDLNYIAAHSLIKSHVEAYYVYDEEFRPTQNGEIGITLNIGWSEPANSSIGSDIDAAIRDQEFQLGWFANPIFVNGDYPDVMKFRIANHSNIEGFTESRLPQFTEEEKQRNVGTSDFFGLNFYSAKFFNNLDMHHTENYTFDDDKGTFGFDCECWPTSGSSWLTATPFGIRKELDYIYSKYGNPKIIITENGFSDRNASLDDDHRVYFYRHYINYVMQAIYLDGVNVFGYTAWSLMDNFEWNTGFNEKFGLYYVDFDDPARSRTIKASVEFYKGVIADHGFPDGP